jgi:hypothetical protein
MWWLTYMPESGREVLRISGNSYWEVSLNGGRKITGYGDRSFLIDKKPFCWVVTKTEYRGRLEVYIMLDSPTGYNRYSSKHSTLQSLYSSYRDCVY